MFQNCAMFPQRFISEHFVFYTNSRCGNEPFPLLVNAPQKAVSVRMTKTPGQATLLLNFAVLVKRII